MDRGGFWYEVWGSLNDVCGKRGLPVTVCTGLDPMGGVVFVLLVVSIRLVNT